MNQTRDVLEPGVNQTLATFNVTASGNTSTIVDTSHNFPFPVHVVNRTRNVTEHVDGNDTVYETELTGTVMAAPGRSEAPEPRTRTVTVTLPDDTVDFSFDYQVAERRNWTVQNVTSAANVSVGSTMEFASFTVENTGNVDTTIDISVSGNLSDYVLIPSSVRSTPGIDKPVRMEADLSRDVPFGYYEAVVTLDDGVVNRTVNVSTEVLDTIRPTVRDTSFPDFMGTKPAEFQVVASDNLEVAAVNATVWYETEEQQGNKTVTVNRTLETIEFEQGDRNLWTAQLENNSRLDTYRVEGTVYDAAGNTDTFTEAFTVEGLDVTQVQKNLSIPDYRVGADFQEVFGELEQDTELEITLAAFDRPLGDDTDWRVGIETPQSGRKMFEDTGETVTVSNAGDLKLYLYSEEAAPYTGNLEFEGVEAHVPIPDMTFQGWFRNYTVPKYQEFPVFDMLHRCDAVTSDVRAEAGWNCSYFVPVTAVDAGSSLEQELQTVTPKDVNDREERWQDDIESAWTTADRRFWMIVGLVVMLVLTGLFAVYVWRIYPYHIFLYLKDTERGVN